MPSVLDKERLKLFAKRGPGFGSKALPARWLPLAGGPSQPVLDDDKSRARSSLLSPEMGIQLLGVLNHTENEDHPHASVLASIDRGAIAFLKVLRLSDKRFVVKTRVRALLFLARFHSFLMHIRTNCHHTISHLYPLFPLYSFFLAPRSHSGIGIAKSC